MDVTNKTIQDFEAWCANGSAMSKITMIPIRDQNQLSNAEQELVQLVGDSTTPLILSGATIWKLDVRNVGVLHLDNCKIGGLVAHGESPTYQINDCMIGNFAVRQGFPVQRLEWDGGYLGQFHLDRPLESAFVGDVWFRRVRLPTNAARHGEQWLRDTRAALNARNNFVAAGIFHASELALSRRREPTINQVASWVYQAGSDFGNSIGRPIAWFSGVLALIFAIAFVVGTTADPGAAGWQKALQGDGERAQILRAGVYSAQSIFNPLNLFVPKPLVSVAHWAAALAGFALGVVGIVAVALFLLSLRRRFKLE